MIRPFLLVALKFNQVKSVNLVIFLLKLVLRTPYWRIPWKMPK